MVRAVDVEGLLQKYVEENSLERADALYLLYTTSPEEAAKTLRARYGGRSGALSSVLDDLKAHGIKDVSSYEKAEDTGEYMNRVVEGSFKQMCLDPVMQSAKKKAATLSQPAREILYLISIMRSESVETSSLRRFYRLLFRRRLTDREFERVLDELKGCYVIQYVSERYGHVNFPPYFDDLLREIGGVMPMVEVKVSWPEG